MIKVGIVGGTGYTGVELLRILSRHPDVEISFITSRADAGSRVQDMFVSLRGVLDLEFVHPDVADFGACDAVFTATPNGVAMNIARDIVDKGARIIDLAADFRLSSTAVWEQWYGMPHACPDLLAEAAYGLPEFNRDAIRAARIVGNPGCYPTAVQLGLLPLVEAGAVDVDTLVADVKSGVSGAGRKESLATQFVEVSESFKAYAAHGHRHLPEIVQGLAAFGGREVKLTFVPHLVPINRGILATLYARLTEPGLDLQSLFESRYGGEPFVDVLPAGMTPETRSVRGSNLCRIACLRPQDGDTAVVLAAEDNLVKGAAGQAVQNMNIMFDIDQTRGLETVALLP